jgi:hypothetical protein
MMIERDEEFTEWPRVLDPVAAAFGELFVAIIEATEDGSETRRKAMIAALEAQRQIVAALRAGPVLQ